MIYVFDTGPFIALFRNYYPKTFKTLWQLFDSMVDDGSIVSTREVRNEILFPPNLATWSKTHKDIFTTPTANETNVVRDIYAVKHFQQNIEAKKLFAGGNSADPFVVAKAAVIEGAVVTTEEKRPNAAKIPNICENFNVNCLSLEEFMEEEDWQF